MALKDFEEYLLFTEFAAENLYVAFIPNLLASHCIDIA